MPGVRRSSGWPSLRSKSPDFLSGVVLLTGVIVLLLLLPLFPATVQSACLNKTFIAVTSALTEPTERAQWYDSCLPGGSQLLAGERGRLRLFQMNLAFAGPEAAELVLGELSPETSEGRLAHVKLGQAYLEADDEDAAIATWSEVDARPTLIGIGNVAYEAGDHQRAVKFWQAARALWQQHGLQTEAEKNEAWKVLGKLAQIRGEDGDFRLAAGAYAEQVQLGLQGLDTHIYADQMSRAGEMYRKVGDMEQAKRWFEAARELEPDGYRPYYGLGLVFAGEGQWDQAASYLETAVDLEPDYAGPWQWLGKAYEQLGQYDLAYDAYIKMRALEPQNANSHIYLARVSSKMGEWKLAIGYYREAIRLAPQHSSDFWLEIGRAYKHLAEQASACEAFRQALKLSPESPAAQREFDAAGCEPE